MIPAPLCVPRNSETVSAFLNQILYPSGWWVLVWQIHIEALVHWKKPVTLQAFEHPRKVGFKIQTARATHVDRDTTIDAVAPLSQKILLCIRSRKSLPAQCISVGGFDEPKRLKVPNLVFM